MHQLKKVSPLNNFSWNRKTDGDSSKTKKNYMQLGNKIKEERIKHNLTQEALGKMVDCSSSYISSLEKGKQPPGDEFLARLEKTFQLEQKALRDLKYNHSTAEIEGFEELEYKTILDRSPDFIHGFVETLLSFDEDYAREKVVDFTKQLQNDYFNRLTPYELKEVKKRVISIKRNWVHGKSKNGESEEDIISLQGYIIHDDQKHYFSFELTPYAIQLNLLHNERNHAQNFESWLGSCSVSFSSSFQLPFLKEEEKMSCYLWFSPHISIADTYSFLAEQDININNLEISDPRLSWFIHEMTVENE